MHTTLAMQHSADSRRMIMCKVQIYVDGGCLGNEDKAAKRTVYTSMAVLVNGKPTEFKWGKRTCKSPQRFLPTDVRMAALDVKPSSNVAELLAMLVALGYLEQLAGR